MTISDERKDHVIDLYYNQGKTTREIARIERMSIRDISAILKEEESKQHKYKHQQQQREELSGKAYELFSKGKTPVEVAIALNLRAPEVTIMCKEYWELIRLEELHSAYNELGDNGLGHFVELYKLAKTNGMTVEKVINALAIAGEELPYLEEKCELLNVDVNALESKKQKLQNDLNILNDRIARSKESLKSYDMSCIRKRQELENLNNEISNLKALVNQFKSCDEGYFMIKKIVEENVTSVLVDGKKLLQLAIISIIESLRRCPDAYKHLLFYDIPSSSSTTMPIQQSLPLNILDYKNIILNEANRLYDSLMKYFQNKIMDNDIFEMISLSSLPFNSSGQSNQMDIYGIEEEPESYHDDNDNDE
jgi:phage shock protein A